ncbi:mycothiol synthase [Dermatobacter hominis]|uniref:mycothiol synthase n=1 Tax=Dermatobacter hominis TaxID=2884263 RepID=UPI001D111361|nr:mycothiol synthase [Dermatobacter hominis]UDY36020.1 mycothiol synthase [Dermatobacter hominis]
MAPDEALPSPGDGTAAAGTAAPVRPEPEWISPVTAEVDADMRAEGRTLVRLLHQMRCDLPLSAAVVDATTPIDVRPFRAGDEDGWLGVNNRAFRWHPDQGGWDRDRLAARLAEPWVRLDGFLVHEGPEGMDGFCWTREHPASGDDPAMGEIFVIAADPSTAGRGLGRSLTVAGLAHLAGRGLHVGMLYVEATNTPALRLYERLGFVVHHSDAAYTR